MEKCVKLSPDADFILGFESDISYLIKWESRKINIPLVIFNTNVLNRPYVAKMTSLAYVWYCEYFAKPLMRKYKRENLIYQGMAANPYIFYPLNIKRIYDVSFFGQHYGERDYWIKKIEKFCSKEKLKYSFPKGHGRYLPWTFDDINRFYNQTKINIVFAPKEGLGRKINLRTFEVCMAGAFQLLQYTPVIEQYFEIDKEIVCWKNEKELFEKTLYFAKNNNEREKIARNGYKRAIENHTWSKRIEDIAKFLEKKDKVSISKYILNSVEIYENFNLSDLKKGNKKFVISVLKQNGYKKRDLMKLNSIEITLKNEKKTYYQIVDPNEFLYIKLFGNIVMVIKVLSPDFELDLKDWDELQKGLYLYENFNFILPRFGILTNGKEWLLRDFKFHRWLKNIPSRKFLKASLNYRKAIVLLIINWFMKSNFLKIFKILIPFSHIQKYLSKFYWKIFNIKQYRYDSNN